MAFGKFCNKVAARVMRKDNKAQGVDNDVSLSPRDTKDSSALLQKAKLKIKRCFHETPPALHRETDEGTPAILDSSDFRLPSIDLTTEDLSIITTEAFDTLQRTVVIDSTLLEQTARIENLLPPESPSNSIAVAPNASSESLPSTASAITRGSGEDSLNTASSTETALSVHVTAEPPSKLDIVEPVIWRQPLSSASLTQPIDNKKVELSHPPAAMTNTVSKSRQPKIAEVLQKLKTKFWSFHNTNGSAVALEYDEDGILERCQWDIITKIDRASIIEIVRRAVIHQGFRDPAIRIIGTAQGTYHYVFKVKTCSSASDKINGWIVKIPGHGTPDRWTDEDEYMLDQEVTTLNMLSEYTYVPSAEVIDHSATLDNEFGFPYIVMEELPGKSATDLWFEDHGEIVSPETEQKRLNFLRSLARHMTELGKLEFGSMGLPAYYDVVIPECEDEFEETQASAFPAKHYFVWPFCDSFRSIERGPFQSTQQYIRNARDEEELPLPNEKGKYSYEALQELGISKIFDMVFSHPVFSSSSTTHAFTIRHSDLDTQNIFIDGAGNITGILDWDGSLAMPRCVGHAAVPHFLERDYYPDAALKSLFLSWRANHYRSVYAAALVEAGNPDAKYTTKSHIYQAAFAALYEGGDKATFVERVLREIPTGLHMELEHLMALIGKGCKVTEDMLKRELWKVLEPELPKEGLLDEVEEQHKKAAVQAWMDGFVHFEHTAVAV